MPSDSVRRSLTPAQRRALIQAVVAPDENGLCFAATAPTVRILRSLGFATDVDQRAYGFRITDAGREEVVCGFRYDHDPVTLTPRGERCCADLPHLSGAGRAIRGRKVRPH